jgi:hypothetical protein
MRPSPAKHNLSDNRRHKRRQTLYVRFMLLVSFLNASSAALPAGFSAHDASEGVYTVPQAERGKKLFDGACRLCHSDDPNFGGFGVPAPGTHSEPGTRRGLWLGDDRPVMGGLVGERGLARYRTAGELFTQMRRRMPPSKIGVFPKQRYADILAYVLQRSGYPPGPEELPGDFAVLKNVTLHEKGFHWIFNGRNLDGLKFMIGPNCKPQPEGCGRTEPGDTFRVQNSELITTGTPHGYWYTSGKYMNFDLRFDYRNAPYPDAEPDEPLIPGVTGYLLFITDHQVWPKCLEFEGANLAAVGVGAHIQSKYDAEARKRAERPFGEWNSVEIVSKDGQVLAYLNGALVSTVTQHEFQAPGYIGFQSKGGEVHWRNIRIKSE